jgi:hypothetical protein
MLRQGAVAAPIRVQPRRCGDERRNLIYVDAFEGCWRSATRLRNPCTQVKEINMVTKLMGALGALTLAATPMAASAADASKLSLAPAATTAAAQGEAGAGGGAGILGAAIGVGVIAILVLGLTVGDDDNDDESPASP